MIADVVNPLLVLPRDVVRLVGVVNVSWAAIGPEVDFADLVAIEALRLFRFPLYQAIRSHGGLICGAGSESNRDKNQLSLYDEVFLASARNERERSYIRVALRRLFPRLDSVWANIYHSSSELLWGAKRGICSSDHFSIYFSLSLGSSVLPRQQVQSLLANSGSEKFVKEFFLERSSSRRAGGQSEVPLALSELTELAREFPIENIEIFLRAIFEISDKLDQAHDESKGEFSHGNDLRLHWLLNGLVRDRLDQGARSKLFRKIVPNASLDWMINITSRLRQEHWPRTPEDGLPEAQRFVDAATARYLTDVTLKAIREASANGSLLNLRHFLSALYRWRDFSAASDEVIEWTNSQLASDKFVLRMAHQTTGTVWRSSIGFDGMGDRVSQGLPQVQLQGLSSILDVDRFLTRATELGTKSRGVARKQLLERFFEGLRRYEEEGHRRGARVAKQTKPTTNLDKSKSSE